MEPALDQSLSSSDDAREATRRLSRSTIVRGALAAMALTVVVYGPILYYMVLNWWEVEDYSHGFVIVPLALYFVWERRHKLAAVAIEPSWWGLIPLSIGLLALAIGRVGTELMSMRMGFVFTLIGIVVLLLGARLFRIVAFPLLFLFLMVPLPQSLVNVVAFPLQLLAAKMAVAILQAIGDPVLLEGNIIHLPQASLFVAEACSGLRSLMALITLGVVFGYFFRKSWGERLLIVASAIPIAILVNALRVAITGYLTARIGQEATSGLVHEFQGFMTFGVACLLLLLEARLIALLWPKRWRGGQGVAP